MKEIMAIIRANMVNPTKQALANNGFPAFCCRKCLGRGKKAVEPEVIQAVIAAGQLPENSLGEHMTEYSRLIAKRFFTIIVDDDQVKDAVDVIIRTNQTGNPGDGKIFILPMTETYKVRTGEMLESAN